MIEITDEEFERIVAEEFEAIPETMLKGLDNVAVMIENQPPEQSPRLYGLYTGRPLTRREVYGYGELPDRITLYQNNLVQFSGTLDQLRKRVKITLIHEIGHFFGMKESELRELGWA
jgi:predicted Zn-dependent protease with MMP-like domain